MKPLTLILVAAATSAITSGLVVTLVKPTPVAGQVVADQVAPDSSAQFVERLNAQEEILRDLSVKLELRSPSRVENGRQEDLETVVRRVLESERAKLAADAATTSAEKFNMTRAHDQFLRLQAAGASQAELGAFWEDVVARGGLDEVMGAFEAYALANPGDLQAQIDLGNAYLQRLQEAKNGPEMGEWAMKADGAYDAALVLDETNWEARFSKAVSLSFWPPLFGKQGEAISQFETLLEQQARVAPSSDHSQTYLYLGNLYQQQGDSEKALKIWADGNLAFPDDETLAEKLDTASGN